MDIDQFLARLKGLLTREKSDEIRSHLRAIAEAPLTLAIFGQTGVGKSSLANALFGSSFRTDDLKPCTKEPQCLEQEIVDGRRIRFWDMPGLGEERGKDAQYLEMYRDIAKDCDVILWAFQADTRAVLTDQSALAQLCAQMTDAEADLFRGRITVVVTKADAIAPRPWALVRQHHDCVFVAMDESEALLRAKADYFHSALLPAESRATAVVRTRTRASDLHPLLTTHGFTLNDGVVTKVGLLGRSEFEHLKARTDTIADVLEPIYDASRPYVCSARYRYQLLDLLNAVVQKASAETSLRLNGAKWDRVTRVPWVEARTYPNLAVFNGNTCLFDAERLEL